MMHSSACFKPYSHLTLHPYSESAPSVVWALCHNGFAGLAQGRASPVQHLCAVSHIFDFLVRHAALEALSRDKPGRLPDRFGGQFASNHRCCPAFPPCTGVWLYSHCRNVACTYMKSSEQCIKPAAKEVFFFFCRRFSLLISAFGRIAIYVFALCVAYCSISCRPGDTGSSCARRRF